MLGRCVKIVSSVLILQFAISLIFTSGGSAEQYDTKSFEITEFKEKIESCQPVEITFESATLFSGQILSKGFIQITCHGDLTISGSLIAENLLSEMSDDGADIIIVCTGKLTVFGGATILAANGKDGLSVREKINQELSKETTLLFDTGNGGNEGNIYINASELDLRGNIYTGSGGSGGSVYVGGFSNVVAGVFARAGKGGNAGSFIVNGRIVRDYYNLRGGQGGNGGNAEVVLSPLPFRSDDVNVTGNSSKDGDGEPANATASPTDAFSWGMHGANATAVGGNGGDGDTIGGNGGWALAVGGNGAYGKSNELGYGGNGGDGGNATATGGNGGNTTRDVALPGDERPPQGGDGGNATVIGGMGGNGNTQFEFSKFGGNGGLAGAPYAKGGKGGDCWTDKGTAGGGGFACAYGRVAGNGGNGTDSLGYGGVGYTVVAVGGDAGEAKSRLPENPFVSINGGAGGSAYSEGARAAYDGHKVNNSAKVIT